MAEDDGENERFEEVKRSLFAQNIAISRALRSKISIRELSLI